MEPIFAWMFLSIVTERIVDIFAKLFPIFSEVKFKQIDIKLAAAFLVGLLFCFGASLDFFNMVGINFIIPYVGFIISSIFIMAGSTAVHEIITALHQVNRTDKVNPSL